MSMSRIKSKYPGRCRDCGVDYRVGDIIYYGRDDHGRSLAVCDECGKKRNSVVSVEEIRAATMPSSMEDSFAMLEKVLGNKEGVEELAKIAKKDVPPKSIFDLIRDGAAWRI